MTSKEDAYARIARKLKCLAHPGRLRLLAELADRDCCVGEMQKCVSLSQPHVSQSLKLLKDAGIVDGRRVQRRVCYSIVDQAVLKALKILLQGEV